MSDKRPSFTFDPVELHAQMVVEGISWQSAIGSSTGKGVKVAVIDSGVEEHPKVGKVNGYVEVLADPDTEGGFIYNTAPHNDSYGHGTACAAIIRSIAPDCEIYSVKVLGSMLFGTGNVFIAGLRWAIDHGMNVCSLSLGTTKQDFYAALHELADMACFHDTILVTAANNLPIPSFPSMYSSVISVSAHAEDHPLRFYANSRPPVDFSAYGINVTCAWSNGGEMTVTGNSFAAPHITGIVALLLANHPGLTLHHVKVVLRALAHNVSHKRESPPTS